MTEEDHLNPPMEEPEADPEENIDEGYAEDREGERDVEEGRAPVLKEGGDPLELDRDLEEPPA